MANDIGGVPLSRDIGALQIEGAAASTAVITGVVGTMSVGTLTILADATTATITGNTSTGASGTVNIGISTAFLDGVSAIGLSGNLTAPSPPNYSPDVLDYGYDITHIGPTAADWFVNGAVGSSGVGTSVGTAFKTIQEGVDAAVTTGGTVAVLAGVYRESVILTGAYTAPLRLVRYEAEVPTITGAEILSGAIPCILGDMNIVGANWQRMYKATITNADKPSFTPKSLNLHENGAFMPIAIDQLPTAEFGLFNSDPQYWHTASAVTEDGSGYIDSLTDISVLPNYSALQLTNAEVKLYGSPNITETGTITAYDGVSKIDITSTVDYYTGLPYADNYALINIMPNMEVGQWGYFVETNGDITVYFWPTDSANVTAGIEYSKRDTGIDISTGENVVIEGFEVFQQAGTGTVSGLPIGHRTSATVSPRRVGLTVKQCCIGKTMQDAGGYGGIYTASIDSVILENNTMVNLGDNYGLFVHRCASVSVTSNYVYRAERSPMRFYGGGGTVGNDTEDVIVSFNKMEECGREIHSNKMNFYEGCDTVLIYGNKFVDCYGYFTYQESSNIVAAFNEVAGDHRLATTDGGRAVVDQNHVSDGPPDNTGILDYFNNHSIPNPKNITDGDGWELASDQDLQTTNFYNNIFNGGGVDVRRAAARLGDQKNNLRTVSSGNTYYTDATDIDGTTIADVYTNAPSGDFTFSSGSLQGDPAYDMSTKISSVYEVMFPTFDFDQDINKIPLTTAFLGAVNTVASGTINPEFIPMGLGPDADITHLILLGLNVAATPTTTATISGVSATGSAGTLTVQVDAAFAITGVAGTGSVGSLSVVVDAAFGVTGVAGTGAAGTVTVSTSSVITADLTGVSATGSVGVLVIPSGTITATISGVEATGTAGTLTIATTRTWVVQSENDDIWTEQTEDDTIWTEQTEDDTEWTKQ